MHPSAIRNVLVAFKRCRGRLRFEWDEDKNEENIRKHGIDFSDAEDIFNGPLLYEADTREDYREERWVGIGQIRGRVVVIAFAECGESCIRVISVRKATTRERKRYEEAIKDELEPGRFS